MLFHTEKIFHYQPSLSYISFPREATKVVSRLGHCPKQKGTSLYAIEVLNQTNYVSAQCRLVHCRSTRYGWYGFDRTTFFGWYGKPYHNFDRKK